MTRRPTIIITLGDPCGIGPELLLGSLHAINRWARVVVVGAKAGVDMLESLPGAVNRRIHWRWGRPVEAVQAPSGAKVYGLWTSPTPDWEERPASLMGHASWIDSTPDIRMSDLNLGQGSAMSGRAAIQAVNTGAKLVLAGHGDALVTLPLSKAAVHLAGFPIPGHTEYLQELSAAPITRMAFVSPSLSVVLHTVHQSLRSVLDSLSSEFVAETLSFSADRFIQLTGKMDLKVALCALNPHAGESGAFGDEETALEEAMILAEASFMNFAGEGATSPYSHVPSPFHPGPIPEGWDIFPVKSKGFTMLGGQRGIEIISRGGPKPRHLERPAPRFYGPLPADTVFHRAAMGEFDLVVALYHDQGLIPIKVLEPTRAVNLTLGLPFVRTSPDHGTAFDLAGQWSADYTNFLEATALAVRLAGRAKNEPWNAEVTQPGPGHP